MPRPQSKSEYRRKHPIAPDRPASIDVTQVIGTVEITDEPSDLSAHDAAMLIVSRWDTPGRYRFPMEDGRTCVVSYEYDGETDYDRAKREAQSA